MPTAGYSGTPLPRKLGIKPGFRCCFPGAPADFGETLGELPEGVSVLARPAAGLDLAVLFSKRASDAERRFAALAKKLTPAGMLWVAWPKKASGVATDLSDGAVRAIGLAAGLVDNKTCAIDETWSGLRFVVRLKDRPAAGAREKATRRRGRET
jgi:hypothetical protein